MALWGKTDTATNSPIWATAYVNETANSVNQAELYNNVTADAYITGATIGVFGVAPGEINTAGAAVGQVASVTVTAAGANYTSVPTVVFTGGGPTASGAAGTATLKFVTVVVGNNRGSGYTIGDTSNVSGGTFTTVAVANVISIATVAGQDETNFNNTPPNGTFAGGSDYDAADTITLSDGTVITVDVVAANVVTEFTVTTASTSGNTTDNITLTQSSSSGAGTGFTLTLGDANQSVWNVSIATAGVYSVLPTLNEAATANVTGAGTGLTLDLTAGVHAVTVTDGGANYTSAPAVSFTGGAGTGATATSALASEESKITSAGWVIRKKFGNRTQFETLVAMKSITGDGSDDSILPE